MLNTHMHEHVYVQYNRTIKVYIYVGAVSGRLRGVCVRMEQVVLFPLKGAVRVRTGGSQLLDTG